MDIAERIQKILSDNNMTMYALEKKYGINQKSVRSILSGHSKNPSIYLIKEIANAFNLTVSELIGETKNEVEEYSWLISRVKKLSPDATMYLKYFLNEISKSQQSIPMKQNDRTLTINTIPIMGKVAAGTPIEAIEQIIRKIPRNDDIPKMADFGLEISGDSMEPLIPDNSIVFIKRQKSAENKQIVIARHYNEVTCKRFYRFSDRVELHSENPKYEPIKIKDDSFEIVGIVLNYS